MSNPPPRNVPEWLPRAQAMRAEKASFGSIAKTVRAGHLSVRTWLERFPPGTTPPTPEDRVPAEWEAPARQMKAGGMAWRVIAKALGVKEHTIRLAIDPVFRERTLRNQKLARDLRVNSYTARQLDEAEKPKASPGMLAASRFYNPSDRRYGR